MESRAEPLERVIAELKKLPSIGAKSAQRLAYHLLQAPEEDVLALAQAIENVKRQMRLCSVCHNITVADPCAICTDERRDQEILCVVERPIDLAAVENTARFRGRYHVLGGVISPLGGVMAEDLNIADLIERLKGSSVKEVILATNPSMDGETTALYLSQFIKPLGIRVMRLASGLPTGAELQYADETTLSQALEGRREI